MEALFPARARHRHQAAASECNRAARCRVLGPIRVPGHGACRRRRAVPSYRNARRHGGRHRQGVLQADSVCCHSLPLKRDLPSGEARMLRGLTPTTTSSHCYSGMYTTRVGFEARELPACRARIHLRQNYGFWPVQGRGTTQPTAHKEGRHHQLHGS